MVSITVARGRIGMSQILDSIKKNLIGKKTIMKVLGLIHLMIITTLPITLIIQTTGLTMMKLCTIETPHITRNLVQCSAIQSSTDLTCVITVPMLLHQNTPIPGGGQGLLKRTYCLR